MPKIESWETHKCKDCGEETKDYYRVSIYDKEWRRIRSFMVCKECALALANNLKN